MAPVMDVYQSAKSAAAHEIRDRSCECGRRFRSSEGAHTHMLAVAAADESANRRQQQEAWPRPRYDSVDSAGAPFALLAASARAATEKTIVGMKAPLQDALLRMEPRLDRRGAEQIAVELYERGTELRAVAEQRTRDWNDKVAAWATSLPGAESRTNAWRTTVMRERWLVLLEEGRRLIRMRVGRSARGRNATDVAEIMDACGVSRPTAYRTLKAAKADPGCLLADVAAYEDVLHKCSGDCPRAESRDRAIQILTVRAREATRRREIEAVYMAPGRTRGAARRLRQLHPDADPATAPPPRKRRSRVAHE